MTREEFTNQIISSYEFPENINLILSMRMGKTLIAIKLIDKAFKSKKNNDFKVLFVTPNTQLRDEAIPQEFHKWNYQHLLPFITIVCYSSLHKIIGKYNIIIFDEIQRITKNSLSSIFNKTLTYKSMICMTGTLPNKREKIDLLTALNVYNNKTFTYTMDKAIENNIISDYEVYLIPNKLDNINKNIKSGNKQNSFFQTEQAKYNYLSKKVELTQSFRDVLNRMRFLQTLPSKYILLKTILPKFKDKRGLIFTANIKIANSLNLPTYHSKSDKQSLLDFQEEKINQLVLVNAGGVGFTYKNIDFVILHQIDSNKLGNSLQKLSRSLLYKENHIPKIYILYSKDTQEELWLESFLDSLDKNKIKTINI